MFRMTRSLAALSGVKSCLRSISLRASAQHEVQAKEAIKEDEAPEPEDLDAFTKEFLGNRIKMTDFQRLLLTAGSSIAALLNPRRHDMIACLGETTGEEALQNVLRVMQESEEGRQILSEKPRINTKTVNLNDLKNMPVDSFGFHYHKFLEDNVSCCEVSSRLNSARPSIARFRFRDLRRVTRTCVIAELKDRNVTKFKIEPPIISFRIEI